MLTVGACSLASAQTVSEADSAEVLEEIVVTGSNKAVEARLLPYTVSVIDRAELESSGSPQLLTALKGRVPSLFCD